MNQLFKKIYIATLIEILLLIIVLIWKPSEAASQFFLGRSLYRWATTLPAIVMLAAGVILFFMPPQREKTVNFLIQKMEEICVAWNQRSGAYLTIYGGTYLTFLAVLAWVSRKTGHLDIFHRTIPWFILLTFFSIQFIYLLIKMQKSLGMVIHYKRSLILIPIALKSLLLDERKTPPPPGERLSGILYWISISALILVFLIVGYFFINFAGLNSDEGWYLYAARKVFQGERLYQDFGFTQMPLLPYIYGVGQLIYPSIYTGRITSLIIFGLGLYFAAAVSNKFFNREASIWLLLIAVTYAYSFYFNTIVKTYSLTFLFLVLSIYIWLSEFKAEIKYPLLTFVLLLGFLTRLTFIVYATIMVCIILYEIWKLDNRSKIVLRMFLVTTPLLLWGLSYLYPDPQLPVWNIYSYHARVHGLQNPTSMIEEFFAHTHDFLNSLNIFWPIGIPLALGVLSSIYYKNINQQKYCQIFILLVATFMFISSHFIGAAQMGEYYVPAILALLTLFICFLFGFSNVNSGLNKLILWTARFILIFIVIKFIYTDKFGQYNFDYYNGHPPVQTIKNMANVVNRYYPNAPLLTIESLYVAVEAKRDVLPGFSMAQFSIVDMDTKTATKLHYINQQMLAETLRSPNTKIVILTEREITSLHKSIDGFNTIMEEDYREVYQTDYFGQKSVKAYVFVRK